MFSRPRTRARGRPQLACSFVEQAQSAAASIRRVLGQAEQKRHMLVLVNPYSGAGKAPAVWRELRPLLEMVQMTFEVVQTERAGHAREMAHALDVDAYHAVITVGGDGLLFELVNGLLQRADGSEAVARLPLVPAPGGTGNGLSKSLCTRAGEACDAIGTAFVIAKGRSTPLDVWEYRRPALDSSGAVPEHVCWSFLSFAWGVISDVDLESEACRCCGPLRFTLCGLWRLLVRRSYEARFSYRDAATGEWCTIDSDQWMGMCAAALPPPLPPNLPLSSRL